MAVQAALTSGGSLVYHLIRGNVADSLAAIVAVPSLFLRWELCEHVEQCRDVCGTDDCFVVRLT